MDVVIQMKGLNKQLDDKLKAQSCRELGHHGSLMLFSWDLNFAERKSRSSQDITSFTVLIKYFIDLYLPMVLPGKG